MYYSVSQYCLEFVMYFLLLCFVCIILCTIIGFWGVLLFLFFFGCVIVLLYLFRYSNVCPANLVIMPNIIVWPSDGIITHISNGSFLRLKGIIIHIESSWNDGYTHVSPIYGKILKVIYTDKESQHKGAIYIQIANTHYQIDILIRSFNTFMTDMNVPIIYIKEGDIVYASQPICLSMFGAQIKLIIDHQNKLSLSSMYQNQKIYTGAMLVSNT